MEKNNEDIPEIIKDLAKLLNAKIIHAPKYDQLEEQLMKIVIQDSKAEHILDETTDKIKAVELIRKDIGDAKFEDVFKDNKLANNIIKLLTTQISEMKSELSLLLRQQMIIYDALLKEVDALKVINQAEEIINEEVNDESK